MACQVQELPKRQRRITDSPIPAGIYAADPREPRKRSITGRSTEVGHSGHRLPILLSKRPQPQLLTSPKPHSPALGTFPRTYGFVPPP